MTSKLIDQININNAEDFVYNTACLKTTEGHDYRSVYQQLLSFAAKTATEAGCIEFFVAPSNPENGEFMLWEVWDNPAALDAHMTMKYTKETLGKNIVTLKWNNLVTNF